MATMSDFVVNLVLKAKDLISGEAKKTSSAIEEVADSAEGLSEELENLNQVQSAVQGYDKQRRAVLETKRVWSEAQDSVKALARELQDAQKPAVELASEYEKVKATVSANAQAYTDAKEQVKNLRNELDASRATQQAIKSDYDAARQAVKQLGTEMKSSAEPAESLELALNEAKQRVTELTKEFNDSKQATAGLRTELAEARKTSKDAGDAWRQSKDDAKVLGAQLKETEKETSGLANEFETAKTSAGRAKDAYYSQKTTLHDLQKTLSEAGISLDDLQQEESSIAAKIKDANKAIELQSDALNEVKNTTDKVASTTVSLTRFQQALGGFLILGPQIRDLFSVAKDKVVEFLTVGDSFEKLETQLKAVMGSVEGGEQATRWIQDFAEKTPLQLNQVTDAFVKMKAYGLDPMDGSFLSLLDQSEKLGGGQEKLEGIITAVGQAWAKQKLQQEEILQLVERGVPAWDLLAKATGKTVPELQKLSTAGALGRKEISLLIAEMGKASEGAAADQMSQLGGLISNLKDQYTRFLKLIADSGALEYAKKQLSQLLDAVKKLSADGTLQKWAKEISDGFIELVETGKAVTKWAYDNVDAVISLGRAWLNIKIANYIAGFASLVGELKRSRVEIDKNTKSAKGLGGALKALVGPWQIRVLMLGLQPALDGIDNLMKKLSGYEEAERRLAEADEAFERRMKSIIEDKIERLQEEAAAHEKNRDIAIESSEALIVMSEEERQSYADKLESAKTYYEYQLQALKQQTQLGQDTAKQQDEIKKRLDELNSALKTVAEESHIAGEALRLGVSRETIEAIDTFKQLKEQGVETAEAITQAMGDIDLSNEDSRKQFSEYLGALIKGADATGEELYQALSKPLEKLSAVDLLEFQKSFKDVTKSIRTDFEGVADVLQSILDSALNKLKVDVELVKTGISSAEKEILAALEVVQTHVRDTGKVSEESANILAASFKNALQEIKNDKALEEFSARLKSAADEGLISYQQYNDLLSEVKKRTEKVKDSTKEVGDTAEEAFDKAAEAVEGAEEKLDSFHQGIKDTKDRLAGFGVGISNFYAGVIASLQNLSSAAVKAFESLVFGRPVLDSVDELKIAYAKAADQVDRLANAARKADIGKMGREFAEVKLEAVSLEKAFYSQKLELESLTEKIDQGSLSLRYLTYLQDNADRKFDLLDDTDLSGLRSAIQAARQELERMNEDADATIANLQDRLDELRNNEDAIRQRQYERDKAELEKELAEARAANNLDAIRKYEEALRLLRQIQQEEQVKAKQEAVETTTSNNKQSPDKIVQLQLGNERIDVKTDDPEALLRLLSDANLRSYTR